MADLSWDTPVMIAGLKKHAELNNRAARVLSDYPREDGRVHIELLIGMERYWIMPRFLVGPIENEAQLTNPVFNDMPDSDRDDVTLFLRCNLNSTRIPGLPGRIVSLKS